MVIPSLLDLARAAAPSTPFAVDKTPCPPVAVRDEVGVRQPVRMLDALDDQCESNHAADAVLRLHQLEAAVDVVERDPVGDQRVDVDVAGERSDRPAGHLVAALDAAERRAGDAPAGDEEARHDVERLALAGDACTVQRPQPMRADSTAWRITSTLPVASKV